MVEPLSLSIAGTGVSALLKRVIDGVVEAAEITVYYKKYCKELQDLLERLQPLVDDIGRQTLPSNPGDAFTSGSAVGAWLGKLRDMLEDAETEVNKCIEQQPNFSPWSRHKIGEAIKKVTKSLQEFLQDAALVGVVSQIIHAKYFENMMKENREYMLSSMENMIRELSEDISRHKRRENGLSNVTRELLEGNSTQCSAQEVAATIQYVLQNQSIGTSDGMSGVDETGQRVLDIMQLRVDIGTSSSSSCPREQRACEVTQKLTDVQRVPPLVFGLDNFTKRLQKSIISSSSDANSRSIGIWGMGGVGKTLLAQMSYNSQEVRQHFEGGNLIWLTVSQNPNIKGLYDSLWRQLGVDGMKPMQLEYRTRLYNEFLRTKVFLVLDDVWDEGVLEQLDLAKGRGSVTLVTTRNRPVLKKAGVIDEDQVKIGVLSPEDSWRLFCVHAFPGGLLNVPLDELQQVAKLVVDECKGLPLALKVIGGSMIGKTMREEWEFQLKRLQDSRTLPQQREEDELFGRLKLSYDNLDNDDPQSKECFLDFAAFPEDHVVRVKKLIELWEREGLVPICMADDPTQYAYYLVGLLIGRSLIEVDEDNGEFACKVHDVMRDLAIRIIQCQRPISRLYWPNKGLENFPHDWRTNKGQSCEAHKLSLMENALIMLNGITFFAPKLQILLLNGNEQLEVMPKQFLKGIQNLKVLDLSNCFKLEFLPKELGNLNQLTHLVLWACLNLKYLPKELGKLTQLIHLDLGCCLKLEKLPKSIRHLQSLQWFNLQRCNLNHLPSTIRDLTKLQYLNLHGCHGLSGKRVTGMQCWTLHDQADFQDICELPSLSKLFISGRSCAEILESPHLSMLVKLKSFNIADFGNLETLSDAMQAMVNLEEFNLQNGEAIKSVPSWITSFSKLKVLRLVQMSSLESLPALNTLKMLSTLSIAGCNLIRKLPNSFTSLDAFPSLKELVCSNSGLVELPELENGAMPQLQMLDLRFCQNLKRLPLTLNFLKNLRVVKIYNCTIEFHNLCKDDFQNSWLWERFDFNW